MLHRNWEYEGLASDTAQIATGDIASLNDRSALIRLTEQVDRMARDFAMLTGSKATQAAPAFAFENAAPKGRPCEAGALRRDHAFPDPQFIRSIILDRQKRREHFGADLFCDPAWEMLLDLSAAYAENTRVSVSSLCIASGVPSTTALRWIAQMVDAGWFERTRDTADGRRAFISLTDKAAEAMTRYFAELKVPLSLAA